MRKLIELEIYFNCVLINEDYRDCFLFWGRKGLKIREYINNNFPNLIINIHESYSKFPQYKNNDVLLISKRIINFYDYDTDEKLGKLLGYKSYDTFSSLDKSKRYYNYVLQIEYDNYKVNLYNEMSQNKLDYNDKLIKVTNILSKYNVTNISIIERVVN